ncbi:MAG: hypothetical protein LBI06_04095 [Treponema sp.]|jgi:hypothetical protein|nr:hypothetical protein [Treponema sp.]
MKKIASKIILLLWLSAPLCAADFGVITSQYALAANPGTDDSAYEYRSDIMPRLSILFADAGEFFVSAGATLGIADGFYYITELLHTEVSYHSGNWGIAAGRMQYTDPLGFIASGLFDGVRVSHTSTLGNFSAGAWYTGFLYKKNAIITMTAEEQSSYDSPVDYGNFFGTYFAPRRFLASLDWEHPSIAELLHLKAALIFQVDLSDNDKKYHSQYATLKASMPYDRFLFELGGSLEMSQSEDFEIALASDIGIFWSLPTSFNSRLSLTGRFAGGNSSGVAGVFVPVTGKSYGDIIRAKLSGITVLSLDYTALLIQPLGVSLTASHFVRNDIGTYSAWPVKGEYNSGHFFGTEFYARIVWSLFSDLHLSLGGGAFFSALGNVNRDERAQWRIELNAIFALY